MRIFPSFRKILLQTIAKPLSFPPITSKTKNFRLFSILILHQKDIFFQTFAKHFSFPLILKNQNSCLFSNLTVYHQNIFFVSKDSRWYLSISRIAELSKIANDSRDNFLFTLSRLPMFYRRNYLKVVNNPRGDIDECSKCLKKTMK